MDLLDRVVEPGSDLLSRVDTIIVGCGAPGDHPLLREIARVGTLPSAALAQVAALAPAELRALAAQLDQIAAGLRALPDAAPASLESRGLVADGFTGAWRGLSAHIAADGGSLADRVAATAAQCNDVAEWAAATRHDLAAEIGACLGSAEAVLIRTAVADPSPDTVRAAADVASCVLASVSRSVDAGWHHFAQWPGLDIEMPIQIVAANPAAASHIELR